MDYVTLKRIRQKAVDNACWSRFTFWAFSNEKYIIDGLIYEYGNHEAQLGMGGRQTAESYFPNATEEQKQKAWDKYWALCLKNDWF